MKGLTALLVAVFALAVSAPLAFAQGEAAAPADEDLSRSEARQEAREGRQDARQDGREGKQDARQEGREGRQDARGEGPAERQDARQEAREGRQDGRQGAREGRQDARQSGREGLPRGVRRFRRKQRQARHWLGRIARRNPRVLALWQLGAEPTAGR